MFHSVISFDKGLSDVMEGTLKVRTTFPSLPFRIDRVECRVATDLTVFQKNQGVDQTIYHFQVLAQKNRFFSAFDFACI